MLYAYRLLQLPALVPPKRYASTAPNIARLPHILNPKVVAGSAILTGSYFLYLWITDDGRVPSSYPKTLEAVTLRRIPSNTFSYFVGLIGNLKIPRPLRPSIFGTYVRLTGCKMEEAQQDQLSEYSTLNELFTRQLRSDCRKVDQHSDLTSPADGTVLYTGPVDETTNQLFQVKGVNYSMSEFLGPTEAFLTPGEIRKKKKLGLYQCVIYLGPGDYHRFHTPADWTITTRRHFPGKLLSVRPSLTSRLPGLFALNERVVYLGRWQHGFMSFTAVGATGVGSICVEADSSLTTNKPKLGSFGLPSYRHLAEAPSAYQEVAMASGGGGLKVRKGEAFGYFQLGSTIVLVFEAPLEGFEWNVRAGDRIQYGRRLITESP
ncbi:phosphatidylserine decarboxylase activity [Sparganum proliferum]